MISEPHVFKKRVTKVCPNFKVKLQLASMTCMIALTNLCTAQDYTQTQDRIKSIYVYNFIKDIQWPTQSSSSDVRICLLQKNGVFSALEKLVATKTIDNKKLTLQQIGSMSSCQACDLIFLEEASSAIKRDEHCSSLIITSGFYEKSVSNIVLMFQDNKLQYSINLPLCDKYNMKVSNHLVGLANQKLIQ